MEEKLQRFIPEGWNDTKEELNLQQLQQAKVQGSVLQGLVKDCDENYNLHVYFGKDIIGIIPRNEIDAINSDDFGMTRSSICKNKVNQFVQFKVKQIYDDNKLLLSRKEVGEDALNWVKNELEPGMIVNRNCKKHSKVWGFCRYWRRYYRSDSY